MNDLIQQYLDYLSLKGKSPFTVRNYKQYLFDFGRFAKCGPTDITLDLVDAFQATLAAKGVSLKTQSYYLITLRSFLKFLRVRKDIPTLDPLKIEVPKIRRKILDALSEDEVKMLLKTAPFDERNYDNSHFNTYEYNIRARAIIEFLLGSGVRVSELCSLKISDIDLKEKWFRVTGKGLKQRVCFINNEIVKALKIYLRVRRNVSPYLFVRYAENSTSTGKPITTRSIERLIKDYAAKAGIQKQVTPHTMRRTFAVRLLRKGVDLRYIQEFLGHESIMTTTLYTKVEQTELEKIYRLAERKATKDVKKDTEQVVLSRESLAKLTGMVGKTVEQQAKILRKLEKEEKEKEKMNKIVEKPLIPLRKQLSIN